MCVVVERFEWEGRSIAFGGAVSLRAHLFLGVSYRSLMLVDVVAIPPSGSPFVRFVGEHSTVLAELPSYIHEAIVRAYILGASHRGLSAAQVDPLVDPWLGSGHLMQYDAPVALADEIRAWLDGRTAIAEPAWGSPT